jgi:hypothetical protein
MADALAAVRALLAERRPASPARRATYFPAGGRLVSYPAPIDVVLGAGSLLATMALAADFRAVLLVPLPAVAAVAVGAGGWRLARAVQPYYGGLPFGDPYRPGPVVAGETAVLLAAGAALARWIARRVPAASQLTALQGWLGAAAVAAGVLLPGSGYLASWPAALATLCLMAERAYGRDLTTLRATLLGGSLAALALPAAALLQPALGLRRTAFPLALLATASSAVLPVLAGELKRCPATVAGALLAGGGVASIAIGLHRDRIDGTHPAHVGMCYMRDADGAYWLGAVGAPGLWQPTRPSPALLNRFPGASPSWARWRAAELLPVPEPTVRLSRPETTAGETALEFSVSAPDSVHATTVQLIVASADQPQVTVEGGRLPVTRSADGRWVAEVYFAASLREPLRAGVVVGSPRHVTVKATAHSRIPIEWATGPDACAAWTTGAAGEAMMVRALDIAW